LSIRAKASAPAKVILLGEHFVVHGEPAIVLAIDKRATVTAKLRKDRKIWITSKTMRATGYFLDNEFYVKEGGEKARKSLEPVHAVAKDILQQSKKDIGVDLEVNSPIPVAAGLGSSAAVAVASAAALSQLLKGVVDLDEVFQASFNAEKLVHGNPSGVDPAISTYGGVIRYRRGEDVQRLNVKMDLPLVIGDTGVERSTGEMVAHVGQLKRRYPKLLGSVIKAAGEIVARGIVALEEDDLVALGELMDINHALLCAVGVSNEPLERLVHAARRAEALGAKLTGAGGGGCMIALAKPESLRKVADAINQAEGEAFITRKTMEGVRVEG
jgi:mevalonate kinase